MLRLHWALAATERVRVDGWECFRAAAEAGQTRMAEIVSVRMSEVELDAVLDGGDLAIAVALAVRHGHAETVQWLLARAKLWCGAKELIGLEYALRSAYVRGDNKLAELISAHATQEAREEALPAAFLAGSAEVAATALQLRGETRLSSNQAQRCLHAAAQVGASDQVWMLLEKHAAEPAGAALGAAYGGHKALCLRMSDLCGGKVPFGTLYAARNARVPAARKAERCELVAALRERGANPARSLAAESLIVEAEPTSPPETTPSAPNVACLAAALALAEARSAAAKAERRRRTRARWPLRPAGTAYCKPRRAFLARPASCTTRRCAEPTPGTRRWRLPPRRACRTI